MSGDFEPDFSEAALVEACEALLRENGESHNPALEEETKLYGLRVEVATKLLEQGLVEIVPPTHDTDTFFALSGEYDLAGMPRASALAFFAERIVWCEDLRKLSITEEQSAIKSSLQLDILDDTKITEKDKAALLAVVDDYFPMDGLDVTNAEQIDEIRTSWEKDDTSKAIIEAAKQLIDDITQAELIPIYGQHDSYQAFNVAMGCAISTTIQLGADNPLFDMNLREIAAAAELIGIPQETWRPMLLRVVEQLRDS